MERGDYYEAKAAVQNLRAVQAEAELRVQRAGQAVERVMTRLGLPVGPAYRWNDEALTIEPVGQGGA